MVLDPQNASLPVPVQRNVGGFAIREIQMLRYPYFPDIRGAGLNADNPITSALEQVTLNWASPITVDKDKNQTRKVTRLLSSSPQSWVSGGLDILPDYRAHPDDGFAPSGPRGSSLLAVAVEGRFDSFFKGKESPLAKAAAAPPGDKDKDKAGAKQGRPHRPRSPASSSARRSLPASSWWPPIPSRRTRCWISPPRAWVRATRGRWSFSRTPSTGHWKTAACWPFAAGRNSHARCEPMSSADQLFWEYLNYALALGGLVLVWVWRRRVRQADRARYQAILAEV